MPTAAAIRDFLENLLWQERFDEEHLAAGHKLKSKVRELAAERPDDDNLTLRANVAGEDCEIPMWVAGDGWQFETNCSCEFGRFCPHAAAMLTEASKPKTLSRVLEGAIVRSRQAPELAAAETLVPAPEDIPHVELVPTFHLTLVRESTDSKVIRLLLQALKMPDQGDWVVARPFAIYGEHRIPISGAPGAREFRVETKKGPLVIRRDVAAEYSAVQALQQVGLGSLSGHAEFRFLLSLAGKKGITNEGGLWFPSAVHGPIAEFWPWLRSRGREVLEAAKWTFEVARDVGYDVIDLDPDNWVFTLEDDSTGWFHLSVGIEVAGKSIDLLPILAALLDKGALEESLEFPADGHFLHYLPDGTALRLPTARVRKILKHFAALIDPRRFKGGKMPLHPLDAAALGLAEFGIEPPPRLAELAEKLNGFEGINPEPPPEGLKAELRPYQLSGFRWMQFLARHELHGILADDMGLGKTLQTITHILAEKASGRNAKRPSLVIAPTSVVPNWQAEIRKFAPELRILLLDGPERKKYFRSIPYADVVLTSFALLQRDIDKLTEHSFHLAVLDEAQNIKNPSAKVAQAACKLNARHRLCLSGTPVENHLGELWSQLKFLMPGFLGSQEDFNRRFRTPIERNGDAERQAALKKRVAPLILRRTKDQVAKELPPKTELVHMVELTSGQKDLYETIRAAMDKRVRQAIAARGFDKSQMVFLEALMKLRQICCDPRLLKLEGESKLEADLAGSGKLDYLFELLETLVEEGRRTLLFSQFTSMLQIIEDGLKLRKISYLKLTGESKNRGGLVKEFQEGDASVFLISLKAGGTGLNLVAADTVIHYDPWWNPAAEAQATDRAYRIGQDKPVFVHKLLCQGTVEERIHKLQQQKSQLANALLADADVSTRLDSNTLGALLAPME
ncbi:DEAD/DEAH box helicase [Luteolibacter ambystomatis]|uniref:DEAD/DEAH box helicase n=1 Tax=Luteolibacter ambystomatis TaxID=2824561 RepID=A0A975G813_9BACT|nr:DEAD/DEAH box helicase [Luteolibacter ambystomatis]QUE50512.1 DEAD/DEAH box helicase [Luteolibacter ambystomatis]